MLYTLKLTLYITADKHFKLLAQNEHYFMLLSHV